MFTTSRAEQVCLSYDKQSGESASNGIESYLTNWVFSRKKDVCVAVMYNNVTIAADEAINAVACEIYKNAK